VPRDNAVRAAAGHRNFAKSAAINSDTQDACPSAWRLRGTRAFANVNATA
jgi:hypothetical protein